MGLALGLQGVVRKRLWRVVDVCEELVKFTIMTRDASSYLTDRYSERKEEAAELEKRVSLKSI